MIAQISHSIRTANAPIQLFLFRQQAAARRASQADFHHSGRLRPIRLEANMSATPRLERALVAAGPAAVLERLPKMGVVMVNTRFGGATHERMGNVAKVAVAGEKYICSGDEHDSEIDASAVATVVIDRTGKMQDKVLPRIDFFDEAGAVVFSVIGMDGLEPFDAGLEGVDESAATDAPEKPERQKAEYAEGDPGMAPFETAMKSGAKVRIQQIRPGFRQAWTGVIERVSPGMGFINVMRPDFHLHLRGGAVAGWRREGAGDDVRL
ncbi:MAG: ChuX/HutX family heme-like substrate-binding protein, partial [Paracoccaceae bacterium]